jgi:hypothetical protein
MKLKTLALVALALAVVGVSSAQAGTRGPVAKAAAWACKTERAQMGKAAFRATYGRTAMRTCMRTLRDEAQEAVRNAAQECREERAADPDAFKDKYGENENGRNAFGKCVSRHARGELAPEVRATLNAAQSCKAERRADPQAFHTKYANEKGRRAFARCVAQTKSDQT